MSRLSKYVKEKIVKVLVAALVVGTVAGNGTLTVQAEEAATVVGEESVSGGDAVVKENVVADPEVTPEATTMVTPEEAAGAGLINGVDMVVGGIAILLVLEAARRVIGLPMVIISIAFII